MEFRPLIVLRNRGCLKTITINYIGRGGLEKAKKVILEQSLMHDHTAFWGCIVYTLLAVLISLRSDVHYCLLMFKAMQYQCCVKFINSVQCSVVKSCAMW